MINKNRRNFLKVAGLASMALPLKAVKGQSSNQTRSMSTLNSAPKLTKVTPFVIKTPPPQWGGGTWYFIKLETDTGLVGWGETAVLNAFGGMTESYKLLIQESFSRFLEGKNPLEPETLYHRMVRGLTHQHADYARFGIISAFDTALWDIVGKHYNTPVYNLLGGAYRDRIRSYTYIYDTVKMSAGGETIRNWTQRPEVLAELSARLVDEGFTGLKFDPIPQSKDGGATGAPWELSQAEYDHTAKACEAIREAIGTRADILIGTHGQITPSAAKRLASYMEPYDPLWFEEPCPPRNYKQMGEIARATSIPIATGERLVSPHEFQNLFAEGACAFAQPDLGSAGGITACKKIATLAEVNYVLMAPHIWGGPIITAAAIQLCANVPNFLIQESIYKSGGFFNEIIMEPFIWENGDFILTDRPGIGCNLNEEGLYKYAV